MLQSREAVATRVLLVLLFGWAAIYVSLTLTPSSYGMGFSMLGIDARPLFGKARPVRSDEWIVLTPLFQMAVRSGFGTVNLVSPYHETLRGFYALPILDWSLIFKPQLWSFWVLAPAQAYSLYFAAMWAGFLAGYTILMRQLGASLWLAVPGSAALLFSHLVQAWWTTHGPAFAYAPWPVIVFLLPIRPVFKAPLLFWSASFWVLAFVYPAFLVPGAFAMAMLVLAFRRDALTLGNLGAAAIAAIGVAAIVYFYFGDLIEIMRGTIYPGGRISNGGGFEEAKLLAHLFPYFTTNQFRTLLDNSNECEVAVVATLLPLTVVAFVRYGSAVRVLFDHKLAVALVALGLAMMLAWMIWPVPARFGRVLLWTQVPAVRMAWGFGLLLTVALVVFASKVEFVVTPARIILFALAVLAAWLGSKSLFSPMIGNPTLSLSRALMRSWFDWIALVPFGIAFLFVWRYGALARDPRPALFAAAAVTGLVTFGSFNPMQPARLIFDLPSTPFQEGLRAAAKANPNGWAAVPGLYGALINGAGIPAINHTLAVPQLAFFRRIFPDLPAEQLNEVFNRYAHIVPDAGTRLYSPQPDVAVVPIEPFLKLAAPPPRP